MPEPIRVLRVIARLNMGGPALHVAYLTEGLADRGYDTTLVTGSLARGEESMAFVAEEKGARIVRVPQLSREISPLYDVVSIRRLVSLIREVRPHVLHTHTAKAGAVGRIAAVLAGDAPGRSSTEEATVFDSTGLAIQDLAIALAAVEQELELPALRRFEL